MYALIHSSTIKVGPRQYHKRFFDEYLTSAGIINSETVSPLPFSYESNDPIQISEDIQIVKVADPTIPQYNPLTEQLVGPFYDTSTDPISGHYNVADRDLSAVKNELKAKLADLRYGKEVSGTTVEIQGQTVSVDTDRAERNIWAQAFLLLPEGSVQRFKFPKEQVWIDMTKGDIGLVVQAIMGHVQGAFDWESGFVAQIEAATTKEELEGVYVAMTEVADAN